MTFSPGPWRWVDDPGTSPEEGYRVLRDARGASVMDAGAEGDTGWITGWAHAAAADARLIAAAPEMYDLLHVVFDLDEAVSDESASAYQARWDALKARIDGKDPVRTCWQKTAGSSRFCGLAAGHPGPHVWQDEEPPNTIDGKDPAP